MTTRLYGCIVEYGLTNDLNLERIYRHNEEIINNLPPDDEWPPLSRQMFAITDSSHVLHRPNYAYTGRVIHFGANFKSIEYEWKAWREKFESLLLKLLWLSADVHFKPEYAGIQTFHWDLDLAKWTIDHDPSKPIQPIQKEYWNFEGDNSWEDLK